MSNTDNSAASVESSDDSGNVYDFKDSKTSGVVTVTKTWEDSLSNDERPVPDISISTEKPSKSALGYVITYHGNGLTFTDGTTENEIIVNSTGKIVSGQYKELVMSSGWYLDTDCTNKFELKLYRFRENEQDRIEFFQEVLSDIKEMTGIDIRFCLWLCDTPKDSFDSYNLDLQKKLSDFSFDEYEKSVIVLADIGKEGKLYGFEYEPKPIRSVQVPVNND